MVQLWFPGLKFNGLKLTRGQLLNVSLMGIGLVIPPFDLELIPPIELWETFVIFDSDWVTVPLTTAIEGIPKLLIDFLTGRLDEEIKKFYEEHPERKPK